MNESGGTKIDFGRVESILSGWNSSLASFEYKKANDDETLMALKNSGINTVFCDEYDKKYESLKNGLSRLQESIRAILVQFSNADLQGKDRRPEDTNSISSSKTNNYNPMSEQDLISNQIKEYEQMSLENLDGVVSILSKMSDEKNISIDELLSNQNYREEILKSMVESSYVTDELKNLMIQSDSITQKVLLGIVSGNYPTVIGFDDTTREMLANYLIKISNDNDINLAEFLYNDNYSGLLKESLKSLSVITTEIKGLNDEQIAEKINNQQLLNIDNNATTIISALPNIDGNNMSIKKLAKFGVISKLTNKYSEQNESRIIRNLVLSQLSKGDRNIDDSNIDVGQLINNNQNLVNQNTNNIQQINDININQNDINTQSLSSEIMSNDSNNMDVQIDLTNQQNIDFVTLNEQNVNNFESNQNDDITSEEEINIDNYNL